MGRLLPKGEQLKSLCVDFWSVLFLWRGVFYSVLLSRLLLLFLCCRVQEPSSRVEEVAPKMANFESSVFGELSAEHSKYKKVNSWYNMLLTRLTSDIPSITSSVGLFFSAHRKIKYNDFYEWRKRKSASPSHIDS